jgi:hypothetical protein
MLSSPHLPEEHIRRRNHPRLQIGSESAMLLNFILKLREQGNHKCIVPIVLPRDDLFELLRNPRFQLGATRQKT